MADREAIQKDFLCFSAAKSETPVFLAAQNALCCTLQCIGGKRMIRGPSRRDKRAAGRISSSEGAME